jgi:hypothetical protein
VGGLGLAGVTHPIPPTLKEAKHKVAPAPPASDGGSGRREPSRDTPEVAVRVLTELGYEIKSPKSGHATTNIKALRNW